VQLSLSPEIAPFTALEWLAMAHDKAVEIATARGSVTPDDVWEAMPAPPKSMNRKHMAQIWRGFKVLRIEKSKRSIRHGGYLARWILE
jgi:hypothetical protein